MDTAARKWLLIRVKFADWAKKKKKRKSYMELQSRFAAISNAFHMV